MSEYSRTKKERIAFLLSKRITDGLTADEMQELEQYYQEESALIDLTRRLENKKYLLRMVGQRKRAGEGKNIQKFLADVRGDQEVRTRSRAVVRRIGVAVAAAAAISAVIIFGMPRHSKSGASGTDMNKASLTISPATSWAILTLADGKKIRVDKMAKGRLSDTGIFSVLKYDPNNVLNQAATDAPKESGIQAIDGYNTLATSQGGQYRIVLSDGTRVWLNDSSTLRFPTTFSGDTRRVEVTGEAYFEVAKNSRQPFIAHIPATNQDIEVLGTCFNISAYREDSNVVTTLIEGRVRVVQNHRSQDLLPDEQLIAAPGKDWRCRKKVNTAIVMAWKKGEFNFIGDSLSHALRVVARSYGVGLDLPPALIEHTYNSSISRDQPLSAVLVALSTSGQELKYIPERNVIVVAP